MRAPSPLLAVWALLAACASDFTATEPERADVRIVVSFSGPSHRVRALGPATPFRLDLAPSFERGDPVEVWVLGFARDELERRYPALVGVDEAALLAALAPRLEPSPSDGPSPAWVLSTRVDDGDATAVDYERSTLAAFSARAAAVGVHLAIGPSAPAGPPCRGWKTELVVTPSPSVARFATTLAEGGALVGTSGDGFRRVLPDRRVVVVRAPDGLPSHAGDSFDGRTIWVGGDRLVRVRFDATPGDGALVDAMDFGPPPDGAKIFRLAAHADEVYTLSDRGALDRFDGQRWTTLHRFMDVNTYSGVIATGPGRAIAVSALDTEVAVVEGDRVAVERVPGTTSGLSGLGWIEGLGAVTSPSLERTLHVREANGWRLLPDSDTDVQACVIVALDGAILVSGQYGQGALYEPGKGRCVSDVITQTTQHFAVPFDRGVLLVGDVALDGLGFTFVERE